MEVRFTRRARRHRIGVAHALHVLLNVEPVLHEGSAHADPRLEWLGDDDRGVRLHIVALVLEDLLLVIHVMPDYRRKL